MTPDLLPERLRSKISVQPNGCWVWTGQRKPKGYGKMTWHGRHRAAHRLTYELLVGPIPEGLTIDHLCRRTSCVNPTHMEPVTIRENILRGNCRAACQARQTHCKRGHEFTPENTYVDKRGGRNCLACRKTRGERLAAAQISGAES